MLRKRIASEFTGIWRWGRTGSRKVVQESGENQGLERGRKLKSEKKMASEIGLMARVAQGYIRTRYLILKLNSFALYDINSLTWQTFTHQCFK